MCGGGQKKSSKAWNQFLIWYKPDFIFSAFARSNATPWYIFNRISCFACLLELTVLPYTPYWILSTDYENSALVYSCTDVLRLFHVDFAWILGRTRSLPAATVDHGKEVFTNNNIDVSRMILSRQQGCDKDLWMTVFLENPVLWSFALNNLRTTKVVYYSC